MSALMRNAYRQLKRKHCIVIKYCAQMLRNETRHYCNLTDGKPAFGLLFDIDGVIVRGKKVLPSALQSFKRLIDSEGKFRVPTVFVTNAGNVMRHEKAEQLSSWLEIESIIPYMFRSLQTILRGTSVQSEATITVHEEQVVMAHSPLRMFQQYHNKCVLISGQGPIVEIAKNIGFKKIITIDQMRNTFPMLDAVDHKRRISVPCTFEQYFPRIEVIILFGEPVRWETALQLLVDTLMTDGVPAHPTPHLVYPHIPLLACNMDLQWMAEARMPRFGHGAFLLCLENLYKKITGHNLIYTALIGKPSEITYHHAHHMVVTHAKNIGIEHCMKRLYAIGDNIYTDVFGANLYDRYLSRRNVQGSKRIANLERSVEELLASDTSDWDHSAESCLSILVQTGVYSKGIQNRMLDHSPRDFLPVEEKLRAPKFTVQNVANAVDLIFHKEGFL